MRTIPVPVFGRPTKDPELSLSERGKPYVKFDLAVEKGFGDKKHPIYFQCWLYGTSAESFIKAGVTTKNIINVLGDLDVEFYEREDGNKRMINRLNIISWDYIPVSREKSPDTSQLEADIEKDYHTSDIEDEFEEPLF